MLRFFVNWASGLSTVLDNNTCAIQTVLLKPTDRSLLHMTHRKQHCVRLMTHITEISAKNSGVRSVLQISSTCITHTDLTTFFLIPFSVLNLRVKSATVNKTGVDYTILALNKHVRNQRWNVIGSWNWGRSVLEWPRSMQAIHLDSQRWDMIGSWSPVGEPSANVPQPMNKSMSDGICTGSLHVCQQYNHLSAQSMTDHTSCTTRSSTW